MTPEDYARDLLAIVHGDGGHYLTEHGWRAATDDAMAKYCRIIRERDRLAELLVQFESLARLSLDNFKADIENRAMPHSCGQLIGRLRNVLKEEK